MGFSSSIYDFLLNLNTKCNPEASGLKSEIYARSTTNSPKILEA